MHSLIIAEGALELIPNELANDITILRYAKKIERRVDEILLDRSYHHRSMLKLRDNWKRGRPDLIHISLLSVTSTPLYREGLLDLYLHTYDDKIIIFKNVRLPRTFARFEGLMIDLFKKGRITNGNMLIEVRDLDFKGLLDLIKPSYVIGLSRLGKVSTAESIVEIDGAIVVGGFPRGHFSNSIAENIDDLFSISKYFLDTHVVCSRVVYEIEKRLIGW